MSQILVGAVEREKERDRARERERESSFSKQELAAFQMCFHAAFAVSVLWEFNLIPADRPAGMAFKIYIYKYINMKAVEGEEREKNKV